MLRNDVLRRTLPIGVIWLFSTTVSAGEVEDFWRAVLSLSFEDRAVREATGGRPSPASRAR
jgi:hypothetical protein